jgi:predicted NAD/FAD-dependent oxidoreductase
MCGLLAAHTLAQAGISTRIVDKGRSVGGRLATRRIGDGKADHGAQFFTVRDQAFAAHVAAWEAAGLVYPWSTGWSNGSLESSSRDGHPRYAVQGGMNALAKFLAQQITDLGVSIETNTRGTHLHQTSAGWQLACEDGTAYAADTLVLTAPVPQSLALLDTAPVILPAATRTALERIDYAPCLCLLLHIDGNTHLPEPGAQQLGNSKLSWIADNQRKGISPQATLLTLHAGPDYSRDHYTAPDAQVSADLLAEARPFLTPETAILHTEVKRWRYALPVVIHPHRYHTEALPHRLYFGGDAFGGPRVEGAALSGLAIAAALLADSPKPST